MNTYVVKGSNFSYLDLKCLTPTGINKCKAYFVYPSGNVQLFEVDEILLNKLLKDNNALIYPI